MTCKAVLPVLNAYLDGELSGNTMISVRRHVEDCDVCRAELEAMRQVKSMLANLSEPEPSPEFAARLHDAVFTPRSPFRFQTTWRWASLGAAVTALGLFWAMRSGEAPSSTVVAGGRAIPGEIARDQAFSAGGDVLNGQFPVMPISHDLR